VSESYRALGRDALAGILRGQMGHAIDEHLDRMAALDQADRCNGSYRRHLFRARLDRTCCPAHPPVCTSWSAAGLCPSSGAHRMILSCFVLGMSVRKVSEALLPVLGRPVSPATVSTIAKQLDAVVAASHARPLNDHYRVLMLDGVVLARKTGAGAIRRPVLVALGLREDGKKEVIDFRLAQSESASEWEQFLGDLIRRGLVGNRLEMICVDGGAGLLAACQPPIQASRCSAAGRTTSVMS
jgi:Transposase, Mutator family